MQPGVSLRPQQQAWPGPAIVNIGQLHGVQASGLKAALLKEA
jgi:hypothetical protein